MFINDILQPTHLLLILAVALLVLGPKRLPEVGRAVGRTMHDFKGAINGEPRGRQDQVATAEAAAPEPVTADPRRLI
jgi:sec-independent protein translocase protein TatA